MGIGTELLKLLVEIGRNEKLDRITGSVLFENRAMVHVCKKVGFTVNRDHEAGEWQAMIDLRKQR
jgi:acetyltransferase